MKIEELTRIARVNGLDLTAEQERQLGDYRSMLVEWNQKVNLISRQDEENALDKHILHSLGLLMVLPEGDEIPQGARVFDLGTGGGFPGIPVKIARPDISITLADSIKKKIAAVQDMVARLGLKNAKPTLGRAEDLAKLDEHKAGYDVIISRAVAPLYELVIWSRALVKPGAKIYSLKGGDLTSEVERSARLPLVERAYSVPLALNEYPDFANEEKQLAIVEFKQ